MITILLIIGVLVLGVKLVGFVLGLFGKAVGLLFGGIGSIALGIFILAILGLIL